MRYLHPSASKKKLSWQSETPISNHVFRIKSLLLVSLLVFLCLIGRLFHLQVIQGAELRAMSDNNRILLRDVPAARGVIYDRHGEHLVTNQPVQRLLVDENGLLIVDGPILSRKDVLQFEATSSGNLVTTVGRYYPYGAAAAHVVGYVAEANQAEMESDQLLLGEMTGKAGLEKSFNQSLMGNPGTELIELDAKGTLLRRVGQRPPQAGVDIKLYLDIELQSELYRLLQDKTAVGIVSKPKTGAILAMVSTPSFDPNIFGYSTEELGIVESQTSLQSVESLLKDESRPLINRAISGTYPPGSVYKVVPSVAALESEVLDEQTEVEDTGVITIDQYEFRNWYYTKYGGSDGLVDMTKALQRSNDIYYYKVGEWLGVDRLAQWSQTFGLGTVSGIDLPGEAKGLVPTPVWKERVKNERWFLGNTYHMSIGQGDLLTTPIQVHQMMGVIANGGRLCKPQLIQSIGTEAMPEAQCIEVGIQEASIEAVTKGLIAACQKGGTASPFFDFSLANVSDKFTQEDQIACKTGTAQFYDPQDRTHAWFSIYAPAKNPEIMVTILVEAGGEGSQVAAPVARELLDWWYSR